MNQPQSVTAEPKHRVSLRRRCNAVTTSGNYGKIPRSLCSATGADQGSKCGRYSLIDDVNNGRSEGPIRCHHALFFYSALCSCLSFSLYPRLLIFTASSFAPLFVSFSESEAFKSSFSVSRRIWLHSHQIQRRYRTNRFVQRRLIEERLPSPDAAEYSPTDTEYEGETGIMPLTAAVQSRMKQKQ